MPGSEFNGGTVSNGSRQQYFVRNSNIDSCSGTKIIGLGFPTLVPTNGNVTMDVADVAAVNISGVIFDAGPTNSPVPLQVSVPGSTANYSSNPVTLDDISFRIGGATAGSPTTSLIDDSNYSIIDDMWAWRADHGNGVGRADNTAANGLIVNGNDVSAFGLLNGSGTIEPVIKGDGHRGYLVQHRAQGCHELSMKPEPGAGAEDRSGAYFSLRSRPGSCRDFAATPSARTT